MAFPRSIPVIANLAIGAKRVNILADIPQRVLDEPSRCDVAVSREDKDVTFAIEIGGQVNVPAGSPSNINTTNDTLPRFDQDGVGSFFGVAGQEIAIFGDNVNAAIKQLRVQVRITAVSDLSVIPSNLA